MATTSVVVSSATVTGFWAEFQRLVANRVRDCNAEAGETLWRISQLEAAPERIVIQRTGFGADRVECAFDEERGALTCVPGPAVKAPALRFDWTAGALVLEGRSRRFAIEDALTLILDELVTADED